MILAFVEDWRASIHFHSVDAAVEAIRRRSELHKDTVGILLDQDLEFLTLSSADLGGLLDDEM